jgi:hypothetical protein
LDRDRTHPLASGTVRFAKALDRTVTGSLNDLKGHATAWLEEGDLSPVSVAATASCCGV